MTTFPEIIMLLTSNLWNVSHKLSDEAEIRERKRKEETKPPSRIPGMRDAAKKLAKIVSGLVWHANTHIHCREFESLLFFIYKSCFCCYNVVTSCFGALLQFLVHVNLFQSILHRPFFLFLCSLHVLLITLCVFLLPMNRHRG